MEQKGIKENEEVKKDIIIFTSIFFLIEQSLLFYPKLENKEKSLATFG